MQIRTRKGRSNWLDTVASAHSTLAAYGRHRLEPKGWRELGVGSLTAAGEGFRYFALEPATDWATYEFADRYGQTVADLASARPGTFPAELAEAARLLGRTRLAPYRVIGHTGAQTLLHRLTDGGRVIVNGRIRKRTTLPAHTTVAARLVKSGSQCAVLSSFVLDDEVARPLALLGDPDELSRATLQTAIAQVCELDMLERATVLEPSLSQFGLTEVARLDRALLGLEHALRRSRIAVMRRSLPFGEFVAERSGAGWRVSLRGGVVASAERLPTEVAHPFDLEVMRQIGVGGCVIEASGPIDRLSQACASVAVGPTRSAA